MLTFIVSIRFIRHFMACDIPDEERCYKCDDSSSFGLAIVCDLLLFATARFSRGFH